MANLAQGQQNLTDTGVLQPQNTHKLASLATDRWGYFASVAKRYARKVPLADRPDTEQDILIELAHAETRDNTPLPDLRAYKIASLVVAGYWRKRLSVPAVIDLESDVTDNEGNTTWLRDLIPDTNQPDLDNQIDATERLKSCPDKIRAIGAKQVNGEALTNSETVYLWRWRAKAKKQSQNKCKI